MSSFACENIHQGQERINDESWRRKEINLWLLYCAINFCRFASPLISQLVRRFWIICLHGQRTRVKVQRAFVFTIEWFASTNDAHFESLTASLLSFPTFFRNQQAVVVAVGNLLKIQVDLFWPRTSVLLDAMERKQRPWRRIWSISWHLHSRITSKWKHRANKNI